MKAMLIVVSLVSGGGTDVEQVPYPSARVCETAAAAINTSDFDRAFLTSAVVAICVPYGEAEAKG